mmetsp:Transcript_13551/g.37609  ORF Transcript_13551/g.37609 Transcript_13551/m.37609 type:complete len:210 (+) Transcript_13551:579-1208(+)
MLGTHDAAATLVTTVGVAVGTAVATLGAIMLTPEVILGMKVAEVAEKTMTIKSRRGSLHSQRNSQACCQASSQSQAWRRSHCKAPTAWPWPASGSAPARPPLLGPPPTGVRPCSAASTFAAAPPWRAGLLLRAATTRRSSRPPVSMLGGGALSSAVAEASRRPAAMATSKTSRTRAWSCTWTPRRPSSGRRTYSEASAGTTAGSQARAA